MTGRWIAVSTDLLNAQHEMHPKSRGEEACYAFAWIDLIGLAAWHEHGGRRRGEAKASERFLAMRWNWSRSKVHRFLVYLEEQGSIERSRGPNHEQDHGSNREAGHITICKYDAYQTPRTTERTTARTTNGSKEVPLPLPTSKRTRARGNGERKPARAVGPDMSDTYSDPERIASIRQGLTGRPAHVSEIDILDGLKKQVGE